MKGIDQNYSKYGKENQDCTVVTNNNCVCNIYISMTGLSLQLKSTIQDRCFDKAMHIQKTWKGEDDQ